MTRAAPGSITFVLSAALLGVCCADPAALFRPEKPAGQAARGGSDTTYTRDTAQFRYQLAYPSTWSVQERGNVTTFAPPNSSPATAGVTVVVANLRTTPPLAVAYSYTPVRTVRSSLGEVRVQRRDPAPADEAYFAQVQSGDYRIELRFSLDSSFDAAFDRMLSTLTFAVH